MIVLKKELTGPEVDLLEGFLETQEESAWILEQKEPLDPFYLYGYFDTESTALEAFQVIKSQIAGLVGDPVFEVLEDQDWKEAYKFHLKYWNYGTLHWIPLWEKESRLAPENEAFIYLDSGMAFGTGAHESTRLCAQRLVDFYETQPDLNSCRVVDAGCGSGILALSAKALGFVQVRGFDFDPESVRIADEHNEFNEQLPDIPFTIDAVPEGLVKRGADLLMVNIQTNVLVPHAQSIVDALAAGGCLALSGILAKEIDEIRNAYTSAADALGCSIKVWDSRIDGQWADAWMQFS
ncbi:MAG: 50S ribosomal protein L11 methyltransferase [Verrucomicrobiota bacterium]